jgi:hypothetical protein
MSGVNETSGVLIEQHLGEQLIAGIPHTPTQ